MSAATNNRVYVQSADKEFRVNKVLTEDGTGVWGGINLTSADIKYTGDLSYVNVKRDMGTGNLPIVYTVYELDGANKLEVTDSRRADVLNGATGDLTSDYLVLVDFKIDYQTAGSVYASEFANQYPDGIDDRDQDVVTLKVEGWYDTDDKASDKYNTYKYVVDENNTIESVIKGLTIYSKVKVVGADIYEYVFYVKGDTVTANWEKNVDADHKIVNGTPATQPENPLDKDGDGIVTCDEYYGVTGLKWDDKKNACVTTSGNAVVTVPDTSAR